MVNTNRLKQQYYNQRTIMVRVVEDAHHEAKAHAARRGESLQAYVERAIRRENARCWANCIEDNQKEKPE